MNVAASDQRRTALPSGMQRAKVRTTQAILYTRDSHFCKAQAEEKEKKRKEKGINLRHVIPQRICFGR
jgi:hypothetical protein